MNQILKVIITQKREIGCRKNNLATSQIFELLFVGNPKTDIPTICWKEINNKISPFGKVLFRQYKSGRIRIKKGQTFYFSDKSGIKGVFKEIHPEDR